MSAATAYPDAAFVFTTACDQMRRAADAVIDASPSRTFLFNLPSTWQTETARTLYRGEFARFGGFLERLGGNPPSNDELREVIRKSGEERKALLHILDQSSARDACEALARYYATVAFHELRSQNSVGPSNTSQLGAPLALVGGPLSATQWSLFDIIESFGGRVVLNAIEPGERSLPPPLGDDLAGDDPRMALANHYFDHIVDVFQRPNSKLYSWLGPRLSARQVRGILLWVHVGCDLWRAEAETLREAFSLPLLMLESHDSQGIAAREAHRLQAFVESLR